MRLFDFGQWNGSRWGDKTMNHVCVAWLVSWAPAITTKRRHFTGTESSLVVAKGRVREERIGSLGLVKLLLCRGWINKVLLHSTGNCIHYSIINHNGKEYEKQYLYTYLNHFAIYLKLTKHCKSTSIKKKSVSQSSCPRAPESDTWCTDELFQSPESNTTKPYCETRTLKPVCIHADHTSEKNKSLLSITECGNDLLRSISWLRHLKLSTLNCTLIFIICPLLWGDFCGFHGGSDAN